MDHFRRFCNMRITCSGSSWSKLFCQQPVPARLGGSWLWLYASCGIFGSNSGVIWISCNPTSPRTGSIVVWPYLLVFPELVMHYRAGQLHVSDELWGPLEEMKLFGAVIQNHTSTHEEHTYGHWFFMALHLLITNSYNHPIWCNGKMCQLAIIMDILHS